MPGRWRNVLSEPWTHGGYLEEWVCPHCPCTTRELAPFTEMAACCFLSLMAWWMQRREGLIDAG